MGFFWTEHWSSSLQDGTTHAGKEHVEHCDVNTAAQSSGGYLGLYGLQTAPAGWEQTADHGGLTQQLIVWPAENDFASHDSAT